MTKQEVLEKLTAICAKSEHCIDDMRKKMYRWQIDNDIQQEVIDFLVKEHYIDEERYAALFIKDKIQFNRWGKQKVKQALYAKRIPSEIFEPLLKEIPDEDYEEILLPLLKEKNRTVTAKNDYDRKAKLIRFAMQRGFSYDQIINCLDRL